MLQVSADADGSARRAPIAQSPIALYTALYNECDQQGRSLADCWQQLATSTVTKCIQQQTDDSCLFMSLSGGERVVAKFLPRGAMLALYMPSSCVGMSVTRRYCVKTAKRWTVQTMPHDMQGV